MSTKKEEPVAVSVNEVRLVGTVSGDPEVRVLPSGDELSVVRVVVAASIAGVLIPLVQASISGRMGSEAGEAARHLLARFMVLPAVVLLWRFRGLDPRGVIRVMFGIVAFCACLLLGDAILRFVPHL